jgi:hypothetical protein
MVDHFRQGKEVCELEDVVEGDVKCERVVRNERVRCVVIE